MEIVGELPLAGGGKQFAIGRGLRLVLAFLVSFILLGSSCSPIVAQLRGHGGPVRALAVAADANTVLSGSFDTNAILWDLRRDAAVQVLRLHDGAVNAVTLLPDGRAVTGGADARIALWTPGKSKPDAVLAGHAGPVAALAVSPGGDRIASASWDHTIRLWSIGSGEPVVLVGHAQNVNAVAFAADDTALVSAGYDATVRVWPLPQPRPPIVTELPAPLNSMTIAPDGEIATAGADGVVYFLSRTGERLGSTDAGPAPIVALAISCDGNRIAAARIDGAVAIIDRKTRSVSRTLAGTGGPVWAVAFLPDGRTLLAGGGDGLIRRWDSDTGQPIDRPDSGAEDPLAAYADDPGAKLFRACIACHALTADAGNHAGPSLHGIFGRRNSPCRATTIPRR